MERARRTRACGGVWRLGELGMDAVGHGRSQGWVRSNCGAALSAVVSSDVCLHGRSHNGFMVGGEVLSAPVKTAATGRNRCGEEGV